MARPDLSFFLARIRKTEDDASAHTVQFHSTGEAYRCTIDEIFSRPPIRPCGGQRPEARSASIQPVLRIRGRTYCPKAPKALLSRFRLRQWHSLSKVLNFGNRYQLNAPSEELGVSVPLPSPSDLA